MPIRSLSSILVAGLIASPAQSDPYYDNMEKLSATVRSNPLTQGGYWLEIRNGFGDWERLMLIFGYADPGDRAACERIVRLAAGGTYRCNVVH